MAITDPLVLPADVVLVPVTELAAEVRKQFQSVDTDYAVTRPRSRVPSKIVDSQTAALLKEFRSAKTIIEAIINYSQERQISPRQTLEEAFPILGRFMDSQLLVPADSTEASTIGPSLKVGESVSEWEVRRHIQVLEDTEVYQVKNTKGEEAALKILRRNGSRQLIEALNREAAILNYLEGVVTPRLLQEGELDKRRYLVIEWCTGNPVSVVAGELRGKAGDQDRVELLQLCRTVLQAYSHLHTRQVIHSDVHPRNLLMDQHGAVRIIDFGLARTSAVSGKFGEPQRGGIGFFFEPEFAQARRHRHRLPRASFLGEQYALAALLYFLLTGHYYIEFSGEKDEMLRQIAEDSPIPFSKRGESWPEVEEVLFKALSKSRSHRFRSVAEFALQMEMVKLRKEGNPKDDGTDLPVFEQRLAEKLIDETITKLQSSGTLFASGLVEPPICSINYGASGIAYALYRIACARQDPELLSLADLWSTKSVLSIAAPNAFYNAEIQITQDIVGDIATYHSPSGVYAVQALIGHAMADVVSQQNGIDSFISASKKPCQNIDLTLGKSSTLIGCSLLLDIRPKMDYLNDDALLDFGNDVFESIWQQLIQFAPIAEEKEFRYLGIAHGWAGVLYASMRWCQSACRALPDSLEDRLGQLASLAEFKGRGARWKVKARKTSREDPNDYMSGWCNGSAGYVFLWTLAHRVLRDKLYLDLAEKAAWNAWQAPDNIESLCCGLAGRAYALLTLYKHIREKEWLRRAEDLANRALACTNNPGISFYSLYKARLGVAVLCADLCRPEMSSMPFFEEEGWPAER